MARKTRLVGECVNPDKARSLYSQIPWGTRCRASIPERVGLAHLQWKNESKGTYMEWQARAFIRNPGGAYDPAPLHEFDDSPDGFIPSAGDCIRWDETGTIYRVTERYFDYSSKSCVLMVEKAGVDWPID